MVLDLRWACREGTKTAGHMGVGAHKIPQQVLSQATSDLGDSWLQQGTVQVVS